MLFTLIVYRPEKYDHRFGVSNDSFHTIELTKDIDVLVQRLCYYHFEHRYDSDYNNYELTTLIDGYDTFDYYIEEHQEIREEIDRKLEEAIAIEEKSIIDARLEAEKLGVEKEKEDLKKYYERERLNELALLKQLKTKYESTDNH